jgi:hypothetical protein
MGIHMNKKFKLSLKYLSFALFSAVSLSAHADLNSGIQAYGRQDYARALAEFTPLAEQGNPQAMFNLAVMYMRAQGVQKNEVLAERYLYGAAQKGQPMAQFMWGNFRQAGEMGGPADVKDAANWLLKAAQQGHAQAQYQIGVMYRTGSGVEQDTEQSLYWITKAKDNGLTRAQADLARYYEEGRGLVRNERLAAKIYAQAAEKGDAYAAYMLAAMKNNGKNIKQDPKGAVRLLKQAANQGDVYAIYALGNVYYQGQNGVAVDEQKGLELFIQAAEKGLSAAQVTLAKIYERGDMHMKPNGAQAVYWYQKAAEQGEWIALVKMIYAHHEDVYVNRDDAQIEQYYEQLSRTPYALENKLDMLSSVIGYMYEKGEVVPKNFGEALWWYQKAAKLGDEFSAKRVEVLGGAQ